MMMIEREYLEGLLAKLQFKCAWFSDVAKQLVLYRISKRNSEIFERINIHCGGKKGESIPARIELSVTLGRPIVSIESILLTELANNDRGTFIARDRKDARQWCERLAAIIPDRLDAFSEEKSDALFDRTASVRHASISYLQKLSTLGSLPLELLHELKGKTTLKQQDKAAHLAEFPGVIQIPDGGNIYYLVCLAILYFEREVESGVSIISNSDPLEPQLFGRIQLIVDYLTSSRSSPIKLNPHFLKGGS